MSDPREILRPGDTDVEGISLGDSGARGGVLGLGGGLGPRAEGAMCHLRAWGSSSQPARTSDVGVGATNKTNHN
eukprot:892496-Prorocentrum_minimum.AAC.1